MDTLFYFTTSQGLGVHHERIDGAQAFASGSDLFDESLPQARGDDSIFKPRTSMHLRAFAFATCHRCSVFLRSSGRSLVACLCLTLCWGVLGAADGQAKPELTAEQRAQTFHQYADQGDASAQLFYGICVEDGTGVKKDPVEAAMWYWLSAQQGNAAGKKRFADLSAKMSREDVAQSRKLAAEWKPAKK